MSTEYVIDRDDPVFFDDFIAHPPKWIQVTWRSDSGLPLHEETPRIYIVGIDHARLMDECGNTMFVRRARGGEQDCVDGSWEFEPGEVIFEQWGLGGAIEHFNEAIKETYGEGLIETLTSLPAIDDGEADCKRCRPTCRQMETKDVPIVLSRFMGDREVWASRMLVNASKGAPVVTLVMEIFRAEPADRRDLLRAIEPLMATLETAVGERFMIQFYSAEETKRRQAEQHRMGEPWREAKAPP